MDDMSLSLVLRWSQLSLFFAAVALPGQVERHGRKYKAPPETAHLEVLVVKDSNGKIIENAAVILHPTKDGVDEGNLEIKSGTDGKAFIDLLPIGSKVGVQVIANGYSTYAGELDLDSASKHMTVRMKRPQAQVSTYEDNSGKDATRKAGVQEPVRPKGKATAPKPLSTTDPVIKLPGMPADPKSGGDPTVPKDHNVQPPPTPVKQPNKTSEPTAPTVDGTAAGSPPSL